jgi:hypothetical protein
MIEPRLEVAPEEYWIETEVTNLRLYLMLLDIDGKRDWRIPTLEETRVVRVHGIRGMWNSNDTVDNISHKIKYWLIPVRDLTDD